MGQKNSFPAFSTALETIDDFANQQLSCLKYHPPDHRLDQMAAEIPLLKRASWSLAPAPGVAVKFPRARNLLLPTTCKTLKYVDIFVEDFLLLGQSPNTRRVHKTLLHVIDDVFQPLTADNLPYRCKTVSLKNLHRRECKWETITLVLSWIVDTVSMTIHLPPHRIE